MSEPPSALELPPFRPLHPGAQASTVRRATADDALAIALIVDQAGDGLELWYWLNSRPRGQSPFDFGMDLIRNDPGVFYHYSNCYLVELDGKIAGGAMGHRARPRWTPESLATLLSGMPEAARALVEIESRVTDGWQMMAGAVFRPYRGLKLGAALVDLSWQLALASGEKWASLVVDSENERAFKTYRDFGFKEVARSPKLPYPGSPTVGSEWVLCRIELPGASTSA